MRIHKGKLFAKLIMLTVIPIVIISTIAVVAGVGSVNSSYERQIFSTLNGICSQFRDDFTEKFSGNYSTDGEHFYSDGSDISEESLKLVDTYKKNFDAEVTVFFGNVRVATTIKDENGKRIIGTTQDNQDVIDAVFRGESFTAGNIIIKDEEYHVSYIPLYDGDVVYGMIFAGMSSENVNWAVRSFTIRIILLVLVIAGLTVYFVFKYTNNLAEQIDAIKKYLGNLLHKSGKEMTMEENIVNREDEIGELGRYAIDVGKEIKTIMGQDPLTKLYNRRTGSQYLETLWNEGFLFKKPVCFVMGDIDFFKGINDKYGHDVGDEVLMKVSEVFLKYANDGYKASATRWGGEEFLLGFLLTRSETYDLMCKISEDIKKLEFDSKSGKLTITATFGIAVHDKEQDMGSLIKSADDNLYKGKQSGRDKIVM